MPLEIVETFSHRHSLGASPLRYNRIMIEGNGPCGDVVENARDVYDSTISLLILPAQASTISHGQGQPQFRFNA